jgi:Fe(3+) dicitrate transport protein
VLLWGGLAGAEEPRRDPAVAEEPQRRDPAEVTITGSRPPAGSSAVVSEEEIRRAEPQDMAELLRRVPGVQARQEYGGGQRLDISIRGLDAGRSRRVLVLEDGVPIGLNPYAEPDLYYATPVERVRSIEVVKGSGNILFGPQTIGGVINFLTLAPPGSGTLVLDAEGGQRAYARGLVRQGDEIGGVRYVVQAFHKQGDGFRGEHFSTTDAFGKLAFATERGRVTLKLGVHDDDADSDAVGLTRGLFLASPRQPTLAPDDHLHLRRYEASLLHDHAFDGATSLRSLVYAYTLSRLWRRQDYSREAAPGASYDRVVGDTSLPGGALYFLPTDTILDRSYEVAGVEERLVHLVRTGPFDHRLELGGRLLVEGAHYQQRAGDSPTSVSGALGYEETHRTLALAAHLHDRIGVGDRLVVTFGGRVEHADFSRAILRQTDALGPRDTDVRGESHAAAILPGMSLAYGTRDNQLSASMHAGWSPPRLSSSISPRGVPVPVSAERSVNYEGGGHATIGRWLRLEATGFLLLFQNQVVVDTSPGSSSSETDAGRTQHAGVESAAQLGLGRALGWPLAVDLRAHYTLSRSTFVGGPNAGRLLPYAPTQAAGATLEIEHPSGAGGEASVTVVGAQFSDERNTIAEDATGRIGRLNSHPIVDLGAHYRHRPSGLGVRLLVKNALDEVYVTARRPEGIFASGFREVILGVRWEYPPMASR